jgi:plastocyanin
MSALRRSTYVSFALVVIALGSSLPGNPASADDRQLAAFFIDYLPQTVTINEGDNLMFANTDPFGGQGHTVTHETAPGERPLFDSEVVPFGSVIEVPGITDLKQGDYLITCRMHPELMRAFLYVGAASRPPTDAIKDFLGV